MRYSPSWFVLADDRILEYLNDRGEASPSKLAKSDVLDFTRTHINQRCLKLADAGLVRNLGNGVYQITEEGEGYLTGEYDARTGAWINKSTISETDSAGATETNGA
ncbi:putative transcriptional regulator [Halarchaeum solikamskense]|nr:putative transcriptional regulator [Halarchaeum solikamskense]